MHFLHIDFNRCYLVYTHLNFNEFEVNYNNAETTTVTLTNFIVLYSAINDKVSMGVNVP